MNEVKNVRLPGGQLVCIGMYQQQPLFSTIEWAATARPDLRAFTYSQGQRVPSTGLTARTATELDTNKEPRARTGGRLFLCYGLTYELFADAGGSNPSDFADPGTTTPADYQATAPAVSGNNHRKLQRRLLLEAIIGTSQDRPEIRIPLSRVGQGIGPVAFASGGSLATTALDFGTSGPPTPRSQRMWAAPLTIRGDKVFQVRVRDLGHSGLDAVTQDIRMRLYADGLREIANR